MNGRIVVASIVLTALGAGALIYWLQIYAFYEPVAFTPGEEIRLTPILGEEPEVIVANDVTGIDADSSPLRFRACFTTPLSQAMLTETYRVYDEATPLVAPGWFDCFDAGQIDAALKTGEAIAFLSEAEVADGIDRVVAVFADGRGYAWHQLNPEEE
ncbi:MAG: hypothetical protein JG765_335 [Cereibacter sp.]|jgi:hypothetical protein|nr:hypothetical protein [Cereibacter sp.]